MKNKKEEISTNAIILIILGIVVLVILILGFTFGWEKIAPWLPDKITITKEECWNVTTGFRYCTEFVENCNWTRYDNIHFLGCAYERDIKLCKEKNSTLCYFGRIEIRKENKSYGSRSCFNEEKEICEQVEVGEIIIKCGYFKEINETHVDLIFNCEYEFFQNEELDFFEIVSKSDLTTSWLDENCERFFDEERKKCRNYADGSASCSTKPSYKCGSYIIEVNR